MSEIVATIVVPSRGGASRLPVLLRALAAQDADFAWEVIIVIDGAVDNSEQVISSFPDVPTRTVVLAENQGRCSSSLRLAAIFSSPVLISTKFELTYSRSVGE